VVLAIAAVLLVGMAWGAQAFAAACGEPLSAPTYQVGETWTWRSEKGAEWSNAVVQVVGGAGAQIERPNGEVAFFDRDWIIREVQPKNGELVTRQGANYPTVDQKTLDFPLQVGKSWQYTFYGKTLNGRGVFTESQKIIACEEVATPAGTFQAFRLEGTVKGPMASGTFYRWYAPQVKQYVKQQYVQSGSWVWDSSAQDSALISFKVQ
jgi:hypothetical protein